MSRTVVPLILLLISTLGFSQPKVESYVGLYFSGDASMYYIGPSYQIGVDIPLNGKWLINGYGHYFSASAIDGNYEVYTAGVMLQYNFGKKSKRWYVALGLAYQDAKEESPFYEDVIDRSIVLPSFRLGYTIWFKKYLFCPELFATGPYSTSGSHTYNGMTNWGSTTELFTLPSIGVRVKKRPRVRFSR